MNWVTLKIVRQMLVFIFGKKRDKSVGVKETYAKARWKRSMNVVVLSLAMHCLPDSRHLIRDRD